MNLTDPGYRGIDPIYQADESSMHTIRKNKKLLSDISVGIAWGMPDNECIGLSPNEFIALLQRAKDRIEQLEAQLKNQT